MSARSRAHRSVAYIRQLLLQLLDLLLVSRVEVCDFGLEFADGGFQLFDPSLRVSTF